MKLVKIGGATLNQTPLDWEGNKKNIIDAINDAKKANISILCLPELSISSYSLEDLFFSRDVSERSFINLCHIAQHTDNIIVSVGLPVRYNNALYNGVATCANGVIVGITCKKHLAGDGIHYEQRHFKAWPKGVVQQFGHDYDDFSSFCIGDLSFNFNGIKIGYEICEDSWVADRPGRDLAARGIDIILNPSASHFAFDKFATRKNLVIEGSRAFQVAYIYTNLLGNEAGRSIYDGGVLIASNGKLLAQGPRFSYKNYNITSAVVDVDEIRTSKVKTASFTPVMPSETYSGIETRQFDFPEVKEFYPDYLTQAWEESDYLQYEECTRAIGLGLMDYMRKSKTNGFAISLSGGRDSAMVAFLCKAGIKLGIDELGFDEFISKYCPFVRYLITDRFFLEYVGVDISNLLSKKLITTAYQPTENSGDTTKNAAEKLAIAFGIKHIVMDVDPVYKEYLKIGNMLKGKDLSFEEDDIVLQNLQARCRAPSIWMIANMENKLLLATSNMSESAVGYATMDGDTAGCISPIAGLPKIFIVQYLYWLENIGYTTLSGNKVNVPEMKNINNQVPTAELRPPSYHQYDEQDLMPYSLLNQIEELFIINKLSPLEIYNFIMKTDNNENSNYLIDSIVKFFQLFSRNQWKRERYALSFHVGSHNLNPRSWCRLPILSAGFKEELEELKKLKI